MRAATDWRVGSTFARPLRQSCQVMEPIEGYRVAAQLPAPPDVEVELGPIPLSVMHFVVPTLVTLVALAIAGGTVRAAIQGSTPAALRCSRTDDAVTCEESIGEPLVLSRRLSGAASDVHDYRTPGRSSKDCVAIQQQIACGGHAKENVARIRALAPGQTVDLPATNHDPTNVMVGGMFAFLSFALATTYIVTALARRNVFRVRIGPKLLEVAGKHGVMHTLMRSKDESVRIVVMRAGRGELPKYEIAYGTDDPTAITEFLAKDYELEPVAAKLRQALAAAPPAETPRA